MFKRRSVVVISTVITLLLVSSAFVISLGTRFSADEIVGASNYKWSTVKDDLSITTNGGDQILNTASFDVPFFVPDYIKNDKPTVTSSLPIVGDTSIDNCLDAQPDTYFVTRANNLPLELNLTWPSVQKMKRLDIDQTIGLLDDYGLWKAAVISFSDGTSLEHTFKETLGMQKVIFVEEKSVTSLKIKITSLYPGHKTTTNMFCSEIATYRLNTEKKTPDSVVKTLKTNQSGAVFSKKYSYPFGVSTVSYVLNPSKSYIDLNYEIVYSQDKEIDEEGIGLLLDKKSPVRFTNNEFESEILKDNDERIFSRWSPHFVSGLAPNSKMNIVLSDNASEALKIDSTDSSGNCVKAYSYYSPLRDNSFYRNYKGAAPEPTSNILRKAGEKTSVSQRIFIGKNLPEVMPFRYPYANDSVLTIAEHADYVEFLDPNTKNSDEAVKRNLAVYFGTSDKSSPDFGKKGILGHNFRATSTNWPVKSSGRPEQYATLEDPNFKSMVDNLYQKGVDIGAHRLTYTGVGSRTVDKMAKSDVINKAFEMLSVYNPTVWIDHSPRDCTINSTSESLSGCGSIKSNSLYVLDKLNQGSWRYVWSSGLNDPYAVNAFDRGDGIPLILYQDDLLKNGTNNNLWLFDATSYGQFLQNFDTSAFDILEKEKGIHNFHTYLRRYAKDNKNVTKVVPSGNEWVISPDWEEKFASLEKYQNENKIWVVDFTTIADYLLSWSKITLEDYGDDWVEIKNNNNKPVDGLTLYSPSKSIKSARTGNNYYPFIRNNFAVLSELRASESRKISYKTGEIDKTKPLIKNLTNKHIQISDATFDSTNNKISLSLSPAGKPGQNLVDNKTDVEIELPGSKDLSVFMDGSKYSDYSLDSNNLILKADATNHKYEISWAAEKANTGLVYIESPTDGSKITSTTQIKVGVGDTAQNKNIGLYANDVLVDSKNSPPYVFDLSKLSSRGTRAAAFDNTLNLVAKDLSDNSATTYGINVSLVESTKNLITNGDFNSNLSSWATDIHYPALTLNKKDTIKTEDCGSIGGTGSCAVLNKLQSDNILLGQGVGKLEKDSVYRLSAKYKIEGSGASKAFIKVYDKQVGRAYSTTKDKLDGWSDISVEIRTNSNNYQDDWYVYLQGSSLEKNSKILYDDVKFEKISDSGLVQNGDFEDKGLQGWTSNLYYNLTNLAAKNGVISVEGATNRSLKIEPGNSNNSLASEYLYKLSPNKKYTLMASYKIVSDDPKSNAIIMLRDNTAKKDFTVSGNLKNEWKRLSVDFETASVNADNWTVYLYGKGIKKGYILYDGVAIVEKE